MTTDIGEYIVGAHLRLIEKCDFIDYNVRRPGGKMQGLEELDVLGFKFETEEVFLCEVTTHITGLLIGTQQKTIQKIKDKHERQKRYAKDHLQKFKTFHFMFWSPVVSTGIKRELEQITGFELVINGEYKKRIDQLKALAKVTSYDAANPFFRTLQILEHLRS